MPSRDPIRDLLIKRRVLLDGHFLLSSGRHSPHYFEKFRILQHPGDAMEFCRAIADRFSGSGISAVAGPTTGGIIIAYQTAQLLGIKAVYAERTPEGRGFLRGMSLSPGEKVLVVDDVLTTGGSVGQTVEAVRRSGAEVSGVAVFIDRSPAPPDFGAPFHPVFRQEAVTYDPGDCPLCRQGLPLQKPGSSQVK
jgi:orotate phosphoribosyltransferase